MRLRTEAGKAHLRGGVISVPDVEKLLEFSGRLDQAGIHVEIERYFADPAGVLDDESLLDDLIAENRD